MKKFVLLGTVCLFVSSLYATMVPISFERITGNSSVDIAGQLMLNVSENSPVYDSVLGQYVNKVTFKFINNGPVASSISEIYFYDGVLLNMYSIDDSCPGVYFEDLGESTSPALLPGYNPDNGLVVVLSATEAENPDSQKGVNATEWVKVGYTLKPGKTIDNLLADMAAGEVVIGVHVKAIGGGGASDSFITTPEPATLAMLGIGAIALFIKRRRA